MFKDYYQHEDIPLMLAYMPKTIINMRSYL